MYKILFLAKATYYSYPLFTHRFLNLEELLRLPQIQVNIKSIWNFQLVKLNRQTYIAVMLQTHIQEACGSNLDWHTAILRFLWFSSVPQGKC
jgi:hypothetical protein